MPKMIGINIGFVTNSSSMVYHFPKSLLDNPQVKAFILAFEIEDGFVGADLWHRGECETFAVTAEQKQECIAQLNRSDMTDYAHAPGVSTAEDQVVIIFGDEHPGIAKALCDMMKGVAESLGIKDYGGTEYN